MGKSLIRTPIASATALAMAGATGPRGFSPMPLVIGSGSIIGFQQNGFQFRYVAAVWNPVLAQSGISDPSFLYLNALGQGEADGLDYRTFNLTLVV